MFTQKIKYVVLLRWTYTVPLLCYVAFFVMIWMLSVPLKPPKETVKHIGDRSEDTFEIRIKNSNFDSDKKPEEYEERNEYLINANNAENAHKDKTDILKEVFTKYEPSMSGF